MNIIVKFGLFSRNFDVFLYKVQVLIEGVSEFGILEISSVANTTCTRLTTTRPALH